MFTTYFFGLYLWNKLRDSLINSRVKIDLNYIQSEVIAIELNKNNQAKFKITTSHNHCFFSKQVLLGVGIPKVRPLGMKSKIKNDILFFNDPYIPDISSSLKKIDNYILRKKSLKILIVGANASSLELLYHITNLSSFIENNNISIGLEGILSKFMSIQLGYNHKINNNMKLPNSTKINGISYGIELLLSRFIVNYSRVVINSISSTNSISLSYNLKRL